eukprot:CAMPEP_0185172322 /NCGR_PEP_ID=MMETSP1139-20130426/21333_1 /TAXON_ID=298111 /ORGANISM="Pavlova sp., Strain CCMP459" /LENGTH=70 /DNA_ID=CAMNT_0027737957 /DNA_START=93 /DNA_END=302 /DNA_ORIENTATION=+
MSAQRANGISMIRPNVSIPMAQRSAGDVVSRSSGGSTSVHRVLEAVPTTPVGTDSGGIPSMPSAAEAMDA